MNNRDLKLSIFLVIGITFSITLLLSEFENNNNILMAQEEVKSINSIDNNNFLQSSPTLNNNIENFKKSITVEEAVSNIRTTTTSNYNDHTSELTIHIPKGSFHPATHRSFNPDEIIINKGEKITWINEEKHLILSPVKKMYFLTPY